MNLLPVEVIERIFYHFDGYSLLKAPAVCTLWRDIAKLYDKKPAHWKRICFTEISRGVLLEMTVKKYPFWRPHTPNSPEIDWKDLYMTWLNWKILKNFKYHLDVASEHKPGHVTCLKVLANTVVVGLHNGEINCWQTLRGDPFVIAKHRNRVTSLEIISLLDGRKKKSFEDSKLRYVISTSHDGRVKISHLIKERMSPKVFDICQYNCSTVCIRAQQNYFAILDADGTISVWMVDEPKQKGIMPTVHLMANYRNVGISPIVSLDIWGAMVIGMTKYGTILNSNYFQSKNLMTIVHSPQDHTVQVSVVGEDVRYLTQVNYHNEIGIAKSYIWREKIFLWITDAKKILISLDGHDYYEYDTNKVLKTYPKSALIYGNIFFLGMESGSVYMYYFNEAKDLLNIDLKLYHWYHPIASSSVLAMEICEESGQPILAVLTKSTIYLIEWTITFEDILEKNFPFNPLFL